MADDPPADPDGPAATPEERRSRRALRRTDGQPRLLAAAKAARRLLPGDSEFGDPLSVTGEEVPSVIGRQLSGLNVKRPSVAREAGLTVADRVRGPGTRPRGRAARHPLHGPGRQRFLCLPRRGHVDVNIAARVAAAAAGGEVLVSEAARAEAESDDVEYVRRWRFRAKGTPQGLKVFAARPGKEH